jgi:predicted acylesterase/phospholipase RssA
VEAFGGKPNKALSGNQKRVLFVRSGGGIPGLDIHAGITLALEECGIVSTHNVGTSAGAIIAAVDSAGFSAEAIVHEILQLDDADVRHENIFWQVRIPWIDSILRNEPIRLILERLLPNRFGELKKPLQVVATRRSDAARINFGHNLRDGIVRDVALVDAVLASMSISGIFPRMMIDGVGYNDGGVRANLPLPGSWAEFDEVWLLIASAPVEYRDNNNLLSNLFLNVSWMLRDQVEDVLDEVRLSPKIRVIRPNCGMRGSLLRFNHNLIYQAHLEALQQLKKILEEPIDLEPAT